MPTSLTPARSRAPRAAPAGPTSAARAGAADPGCGTAAGDVPGVDVPGVDVHGVDVAALVADIDVFDRDAALAALTAARGCYEHAERLAGPGPSSYYHAVNAALFGRRERLRAAAGAAGGRRAERALEALTALLIDFNLGMARQYVGKFTARTPQDDVDDFLSAATLGLVAAVCTFDPAKGRFYPWALMHIQREVLPAVRDADFPTLLMSDFQRRPDILDAHRSLAGGHQPVSEERVAAAVEGRPVSRQQVSRVLTPLRLESLQQLAEDVLDAVVAPTADDGGWADAAELGDLFADDGESVEDTVLGGLAVDALMDHGLPVLDAREHFVLVRRFGLDGEPAQCLSSIGRQLKLSRESVRQVEYRALDRLLQPAVLRRLVH